MASSSPVETPEEENPDEGEVLGEEENPDEGEVLGEEENPDEGEVLGAQFENPDEGEVLGATYVKTGDTTGVFVIIGLLLVSGAVVAVSVAKKKEII